MRLNGDLMHYQGGKIEWWKLRDLFTESARKGDVEELGLIVREYPEALRWTGGLFGTGLYFAAHEGRLDAVKFLVEQGAKLGVGDNDGLSLLIAAAHGGHADVIEYLLKCGADINEKDTRMICGYTALSWAAYNGHSDAVKCLLEHGTDTSLKNIDGKTARQLAIQQNHPEVAKLIDTLDTRVYMFKSGTEERVRVSTPLSLKMK